MKKFIIYCRVSSKRQAMEGYSLADQESRLFKYIEAKKRKEDDYSLEIMVDDGYSASSLDRPKMREIINRIKNKDVDCIYVYCLDRLTRKITDLAYLIDLMNKNDVQLVSLSENVETKTPAGKLFINIVVLFAQWELENILSRTSRGILESAAQGNYPKASIPFGYKKKDKKIVIDPEKAELVKYIFNCIVTEKRSVNSIHLELSKSKPFNLTWPDTRIYKMIKNEIYTGTFIYGNNRIENHSPAIIDKKTFTEANRLIRKYVESKNEYIFKKYTFCKHCGEYTITSMTTGANGKKYKYYYCKKCRKEISEIRILNQCKKTLDELAYDYFVGLDLSKLEKDYKREYGKLKSLLKTISNTKLSYDEVEDLTKPLIERVNSLEGAMSAVRANVEDREFANVEFHVQRDILLMYVERIEIDMRSQRADIVIKNRKNIEKKQKKT